jgi:hypothetical protein
VEAVVEGDDLVGAALVHLAPLAGELDGPLVGLGAGVGKEHPVEHRVGGEDASQLDHRAIVEGRAGVEQGAGLGHQGVADLGRAVPQAIDRPALDEVQVGLAIVVMEPATFATHEDEVGPVGDGHQGVAAVIAVLHWVAPRSVLGGVV